MARAARSAITNQKRFLSVTPGTCLETCQFNCDSRITFMLIVLPEGGESTVNSRCGSARFFLAISTPVQDSALQK